MVAVLMVFTITALLSYDIIAHKILKHSKGS